jgi:MYXO-CTERM domain-containing protein
MIAIVPLDPNLLPPPLSDASTWSLTIVGLLALGLYIRWRRRSSK